MKMKSISLITALSLLLCLCACSAQESAVVELPSTQMQDDSQLPLTPSIAEDKSAVFTVEAVSMEQARILPPDSQLLGLVRLSSGLALLWEQQGEYCLALAKYNMDSEGRAELYEPEDIRLCSIYESTVCFGLAPTEGGGVLLLAGDSQNGSIQTLCAQMYDEKLCPTDSMEIQNCPLPSVECFALGAGGKLLISSGDRLLVYTWGDEQFKEPDLGLSYIYNITFTADGLIIQGQNRKNYRNVCLLMTDDGSIQQQELQALVPEGDMSRSSVLNDGFNAPPCQDLDGEYILNTGDRICLIDTYSGMGEPFLWNTDYNPSMDIRQSCLLGSKSLACIVDGKLLLSWEHSIEKRESGLVRVGIVEINAYGAIAVNLAGTGGADSPYTPEFFTYSSDEAGLMQFQAELMYGAFDLIIFHDEINSFNGSFEDLFPYLDADTELNRESFIPGFLDSCTIHGELKQLWNSAVINTVLSPEALIGSAKNLTVADCKALVNENSQIQSVLDNRFNNQSQLRYDTLQNLSYTAVAAFTDRNKGMCSFDSDEFVELLSLCGELRSNPDSNGRDYLLHECSGSSAGFSQALEESLGPCYAVGWPNGGEGIHYYSLPNNYTDCFTMAIPSNSQNKPAAWGMIKLILSENRQWQIAESFGSGMPVIYSVTEKYNRQNYSAEQCDKFFELLERCHNALSYSDSVLRQIIMEEGQGYLNGDKSAESAAESIQSRVSIYMAEQYG